MDGFSMSNGQNRLPPVSVRIASLLVRLALQAVNGEQRI